MRFHTVTTNLVASISNYDIKECCIMSSTLWHLCHCTLLETTSMVQMFIHYSNRLSVESKTTLFYI